MRPRYFGVDLKHVRAHEPPGDSAVMWAVALVIFLIVIGAIK